MSNSTSEIEQPRYIVQQIISLPGNPDRNDHEYLGEAQALHRTVDQSASSR